MEKCKNCEIIQRSAKKCRTCIHYRYSSKEERLNAEAKIRKILDDAERFRNSLDRLHPVLRNKLIQKAIEDDKDSRSFREIINEKFEQFRNSDIDVYDLFGLDREEVVFDDSVKGNFYFIFPVAFELRSKFVKVYGTEHSTREFIETKYPGKEYIQYNESEWHTPNKYTHRKPCECYTEWM